MFQLVLYNTVLEISLKIENWLTYALVHLQQPDPLSKQLQTSSNLVCKLSIFLKKLYTLSQPFYRLTKVLLKLKILWLIILTVIFNSQLTLFLGMINVLCTVNYTLCGIYTKYICNLHLVSTLVSYTSFY